MSVASLSGYLNNGGGGGNVNEIQEGLGINIIDKGRGVYTIENNGIITASSGVGIGLVFDNDTGNLEITNTGGGGGGAVVASGVGTEVVEDPPGTFTVNNTGVVSLSAGVGITLDDNKGVVEITSTVNPDDYYTKDDANGLFQTITDMANYYTETAANGLFQTITAANATFQTIAGMANYSTTGEANALYQPIGDIGVASLTAGPGIELTGNTGDITVSALAVTRVGGAITVTTIPQGTTTYSQHALNNVTLFNFVGSNNKTAYTMTSNTIGQPAAFGCNVFFQSTDGTDTIVEPLYTFLGEPPANDEQIIFAITAVNF